MVADSKKIQTFVNVLGQQAQIIRAAVSTIEAVETQYNALDPTPPTAGTPLQGNKATLAASLDTLRLEIDKQAWTDQINGIVESHRNEGLT